jgi:hypothetical protein
LVLVAHDMSNLAKELFALENAPNPYIANNNGKTTYELASNHGMGDLCDLMRGKFGDPPIEIAAANNLAELIAANQQEVDNRDMDAISEITDLSDVEGAIGEMGIAGRVEEGVDYV